ncbi:glutathione S-transferase [Cadophora sp. DSE1049]|nr:glutathione S-transferase [Cadophora sp. DSE1049]
MAAKPASYPAATGRAAQTVADHGAEEELVFWGAWFCPFTQRSWITLEEKSLKYQYREVNPYDKPAELLGISPKGLVPILQNTTTNTITTDSLAILHNLQATHPSPNLLPPAPADQATAEDWLAHINTTVVPSFFRLMQAQLSNSSQLTKALEEFTAAIALISNARQEGGPFFYGEEISLVDIAIAPWTVRDFIIREFRGWNRDAVPKWKEWAEILEVRESVVRTTSVKKYVEFNGTFLRDESYSQAAKAARSGLAIP